MGKYQSAATWNAIKGRLPTIDWQKLLQFSKAIPTGNLIYSLSTKNIIHVGHRCKGAVSQLLEIYAVYFAGIRWTPYTIYANVGNFPRRGNERTLIFFQTRTLIFPQESYGPHTHYFLMRVLFNESTFIKRVW